MNIPYGLAPSSWSIFGYRDSICNARIYAFLLNFNFLTLLMSEVVSWTYDSSFCAATFNNESIHSDNLLVHELYPMQIGWENLSNNTCGF